MSRNDEDFQFSFVDKYFKENSLVDHHITSCDTFYDVSIPKIFKDKNPIRYYGIMDEKTKQYKYSARLYLGGKNADKIYYGKPMIYDGSNQHYMFPNEARLRNMTYGISIHYDVDIELEVNGEMVVKTLPLNKSHYFLGMFPIMLQSKLCILKGLPVETRFQMGECKYDYGGYFIVDGKEKVLIPQESFGNNLIYTRLVKDGKHDFSVEVRSVSEDISGASCCYAVLKRLLSSHLYIGRVSVNINISRIGRISRAHHYTLSCPINLSVFVSSPVSLPEVRASTCSGYTILVSV